MSWRTLLGLPPTLDSFAAELVKHARRLGEPVTDPSNSRANLMLTNWAKIERVCSQHLQPTTEDPPRYRVDTFPSPAELVELSRPN
ncbi:MAG TPA: hypothetical protein VGI23_25570 [Steroidobacteraceae bacterium]